jgi:hypothetical protein
MNDVMVNMNSEAQKADAIIDHTTDDVNIARHGVFDVAACTHSH